MSTEDVGKTAGQSRESQEEPANLQNASDGAQTKAGSARRDYGKTLASQRRRSRTLALQALYQWQLSSSAMHEVEAQFRADNNASEFDVNYFQDVLEQVNHRVSEIDQCYEPFLTRSLKSVDPIEKSILRIATYELMSRLDVPYRVVINEAVDLAKKFGGEDGHRFVNGILHKLSVQLRRVEKANDT